MRRGPILLAIAGTFAIGAIYTASAGDRAIYAGAYGAPGHGGYYGPQPVAAGGYGFADSAVSGAYIGAPFTRFPRPSELVAPALSYGTYGVPTVPGIRQAPIGQPVVYTIDSEPNRIRQDKPRSRLLTRNRGTWVEPGAETETEVGGARVISLRTR